MKKLIILFFILLIMGISFCLLFHHFIGFQVKAPKVSEIEHDEGILKFNVKQIFNHDGFCIEISHDKEFIKNTKVKYIETTEKITYIKSKGWNDDKRIYIRVSSWQNGVKEKVFSQQRTYHVH